MAVGEGGTAVRKFISLVAVVLMAALVGAPAASAQGPVVHHQQAADGVERSSANFSYSELLTAIDRGAVSEALIDPRRAEVSVRLANGREETLGYPPGQNLADRLARAGATVEVAPGDDSSGPGFFGFAVLGMIALTLVLFAVSLRARRSPTRVPGGAGGPLRAETKVTEATRPTVTFRDVAGCDEAVEEVAEFVEFLRDPERFARVGARMPAGVLLHGPPGTGKTLLAKALAAEAGVDYFAASGAEFVERYVGVGASRVRELFNRGRNAPGGAVIFIDELDALGRRRSDGGQGGNDEYEHTLNQLLIEMDGFTGNERLVCVGATNRLDVIDPALLRPGRFSRQVAVELPSAEGRLAILQVHARGRPLAREVDLPEIAEGTAGSSGADLREMLNEGAIMAAREGRAEVTRADLAEGHLRALAGPARRSSPLTAEEREVVARHEAGHALVAEFCETQDATQRLTITPRGRAGGLAVVARRDRALQSVRHVHEQLMVLLGGRAAEAVIYGDVSSGAADDLQRANALARHAVMSLGFSERAGQLTATAGGQNMPLSDTTRQVVDEEVERMIAEAYRDAVALTEAHRPELLGLSSSLLAHDDLGRDQIAALLGTGPPRPVAMLGLGPAPAPAAPVVPLRRERERRRLQRAPKAAAAMGRAAFAHARFLLTRRERPRPADH
jgi:cell division protease FtsH